MMRNIVRIAKVKTRELRPQRRRTFRKIGSGSVGVRQSTVRTYDV